MHENPKGTKFDDIDIMVELASHFLPAVITRGAVFAGINANEPFVKIASCEDLVYMILMWEGSYAMWEEMSQLFKGNLKVKQAQVKKQPMHNYLYKPHTTERLGEIRTRVQNLLGDDEGKARANAQWKQHLNTVSKNKSSRKVEEKNPKKEYAEPQIQVAFL